jgi:hypothetical protein
MALRAYSETENRVNRKVWRLEIHDAEYGGSTVTEFDVGADFFTLNYDSKDERMLEEAVMGSNVDFKMLVEDATLETLVEDIATGYEGRFTIKIEYDGSLYWMGSIIADGITIPDEEFNYFVNISASDNLGTLKGVKYKSKSGDLYTWYDDLVDIVVNILLKINYVDNHYSYGAALLKTNVRWFATNHLYDDVNTDADPLKNTRVHNNFALKETSGDDLEAISCYEVLENICKRFKAQIKQVNGSFYLSQPLQQGGAITVHSFARTGNHLSKDAENHSFNFNTTKIRLGGAYNFYPPVLRAVESFKARTSIYQNNLLPIPVTVNTIYDLGEIKTDNDNYFQFSGDTTVNLGNPSTDTDPILAHFKIRLKVGTYYLHKVDGVYKWTDDSTARIDLNIVLHKNDTGTKASDPVWAGSFSLNFSTEEIPSDGDGDYEITLDEFISTGGIVITPGSYSLYGVHYIRNGVLGSRTVTYQSINEDGSGDPILATKEIDNGELLLGDRSDSLLYQATGMLEVYDGSAWVRAYTWEIEQEGQNKNIGDLSVNEITRMFYDPVKAYSATFRKPEINPMSNFDHESKSWIFTGGSLNAKLGHWDAQFIKLNPTDSSGNTIIDDPVEMFSPSTPSNEQVVDTVKENETVEETATKAITPAGKSFEVSEDLLYPKNPSDASADKDLAVWDSSTKKIMRQTNYLHTLGLKGLTTDEVTQLKNIDSETISNVQWGYLGGMDQSLKTSDAVQFKKVKQTASEVDVRVITNGNERLGAGDYVVVYSDTNSGDEFTIDGNVGRRTEIINGDDVNDLTINAVSATINGASSITVGPESVVTLIKIGTSNWALINKY